MTSGTVGATVPSPPWPVSLLAPRDAPLATAPRAAAVDPEAVPYAAGDGPVGVLLCHGFTGSPRSMRPWAEALVAQGYTAVVPRLPGHGTSWREMNLTTWQDWYGCVAAACEELLARCETVVVGGLSMGGALALRLGIEFGDRVSGLVLVNPAVTSADRRLAALPVLRFLTASIAGIADDIAKPGVEEGGYDRTPLHALASMTELWRDVGGRLGEVRQPVLLFTSDVDHVVDPSSADLIVHRITRAAVTHRRLTRSHHVATLDFDAELIFAESASFVGRLAAERQATAGSVTP